jgi:penicillin-insensitive murein endopeptidase
MKARRQCRVPSVVATVSVALFGLFAPRSVVAGAGAQHIAAPAGSPGSLSGDAAARAPAAEAVARSGRVRARAEARAAAAAAAGSHVARSGRVRARAERAARADRRRVREARQAREASEANAARGSISVGRHNAGRLLHGRELRESEHLRLKRPHGDQHHGTDELVMLLERAASEVARQFPGSRLTVGDLSRRRGGAFRPHRSHRTGRDVDIGFYIVDTAGQPVYVDRFYDFRADGTTRAHAEWRFDDARNWALVAALVSQNEVPVQHIFVARWLRERLLAYARAIGAPAEVIARAEVVLDQPSRGGRHDDHFHMRIYCSADDRPRCVDEPPFHPWVSRPSLAELAEMRAAQRAARHRADADRRRAERARARERSSRRRVSRAGEAERARGPERAGGHAGGG